MKTFWTPYISDHTIKAICWTLIHSLWIGLAIALFAGLVITLTRRSGAALRYRLLCGILVIFVIAAGVTFYMEMRTPAPVQSFVRSGGANYEYVAKVMIVQRAVPYVSIQDRMAGFFNQYSNIIFTAWLLLFGLKSLKMAGGLLYIQRIRNYRVHDVAEKYRQKIELFSGQIGIKRDVGLMQSELVKVPVAVGWLKPVILLPVGIILQLSPEQLESILWHELAHIRRRDYLVNILQGLVETIFFFNPGLLWLSSLIRSEREACCDDMVLNRMERKANYLEALLAVSSEDNSRVKLAMSVGSGKQLRDRMSRMVNHENKRLSVAEKVVLIAGLLLLSAFTGLPKTTDKAVNKLLHIITRKAKTDSVSKAVTGKAVLKAHPLTHAQFFVQDTVVEKPDTTIHFVSVIFKNSDSDLMNNEITAMDTSGNRYRFTVAGGKLTAMMINGEKVTDDQLPRYEYMIRYIDQMIDEKKMVREYDLANAKANSVWAKPKIKEWKGFDKKRYVDTSLSKSFYGDLKGYNWKPDPKFAADFKPRAMMPGVKPKWRGSDSTEYDAQLKKAQNVIADLVAAKVVSSSDAVKWFGLSNTELIVNGKKQSAALQQKLKNKYGIHEDYGLYYGPVQMNGRGVFIPNRFSLPERLSFDQQRLKMRQFMLRDSQFRLKPMRAWKTDSGLWSRQRSMMKMDMQRKGFFRPGFSLNEIIANITDDLVSDNLVKDKSDLSSFKLTNRFMTINGKQQPKEVHQKFREKYLENPGYNLNRQLMLDPNFGLHYDAKTGGMGIGVEISRDDPADK